MLAPWDKAWDRWMVKLSSRRVQTAPPGMHGDGGGLWLRVKPDGRKSWAFRFTLHGRAREMGLGALTDVSLAEARELATTARKLVRAGKDPIEARRSAKATAAHTFSEVLERFLDERGIRGRSDRHKAL